MVSISINGIERHAHETLEHHSPYGTGRSRHDGGFFEFLDDEGT